MFEVRADIAKACQDRADKCGEPRSMGRTDDGGCPTWP